MIRMRKNQLDQACYRHYAEGARMTAIHPEQTLRVGTIC